MENYIEKVKLFRSNYNKIKAVLPWLDASAWDDKAAFDATVEVCMDFPNVYVDLAGDYYDNGLIDILADRIGPEEILFASDVDWIDTRCNLAPVLASSLQDDNVLKILRFNALKFFRVAEY